MTCKQCNNKEAAKGRSICETCKSRNWVNKNPYRATWHWIKESAKKRNLPFTLDFNWFKTLCDNTGYIQKRGRLTDQLTIERINPDYGYHHHNVMITPKRFNSENRKDTFINEDLPF